MKQIPLILSFILCIFVAILNFSEHDFFNGMFMAIISLLVLIELVRQLTNKSEESS